MSTRTTREQERGHVVHETIPIKDLVEGERQMGSVPNEAGTVTPTLPPWMRKS